MSKNTINSKNLDAQNKSTKALLITAIAAGAVILALIVSIVIIATNKNTTQTINTTNDTNTQQQTEKVVKTVTGKNDSENQADALKATTELLNNINDNPKKLTPRERAEKIDKGDYSVVNKKVADYIHFVPSHENDNVKATVYQALIALTEYLNKDGKNKIAPVSDNEASKIYVDSELGIAYVPMSIYYGSENVFSLEMVYTDSKWKLAPYSFVEAVKMSAGMTTK